MDDDWLAGYRDSAAVTEGAFFPPGPDGRPGCHLNGNAASDVLVALVKTKDLAHGLLKALDRSQLSPEADEIARDLAQALAVVEGTVPV